MDFSGLWYNPLISPTILNASRENKAEFSTKAVQKMERNPPVGPAYAALIAACRGAHDLFISYKDGSDVNVQKAATQRLDALVPVIVSTGKVLEAALLIAFETDQATIVEFFPRGRTELGEAKRGDMEGILNRFVSRATFHQAELGAGWVTRLTTLRTQWNTNMSLQSGAVSDVESARGLVEAAWETLTWAHLDFARQLAYDNPRFSAIENRYYNFGVFTGKSNSGNDNVGTLRFLVLTAAGEPLVNAYWEITDQNNQIMQTGFTNNEGFSESDEMALGFYDVLAKQNGYVPKIMQFQVLDDSSPVREIRLSSE